MTETGNSYRIKLVYDGGSEVLSVEPTMTMEELGDKAKQLLGVESVTLHMTSVEGPPSTTAIEWEGVTTQLVREVIPKMSKVECKKGEKKEEEKEGQEDNPKKEEKQGDNGAKKQQQGGETIDLLDSDDDEEEKKVDEENSKKRAQEAHKSAEAAKEEEPKKKRARKLSPPEMTQENTICID